MDTKRGGSRAVLGCAAWTLILGVGLGTYFYLQGHPLAYFANHPWGSGVNVALSIAVTVFGVAIVSVVIPDESSHESDTEDQDRLEPRAGCFLTAFYVVVGIGVALYMRYSHSNDTSIMTGVAVWLILMIITVALDSPKGPKHP